jgi:hypothetical protein
LHKPRRLDSQGGLKQLGLVRHSSRCLAGLIAAFCRNQPRFSFFTPRASSVRFAGLAPALDPAVHPLEIRKRQLMHMIVKGQMQCARGTHPSAADQFYEWVT